MKKKPRIQASKRERRIQDKKHRGELLEGKILGQIGVNTVDAEQLIKDLRIRPEK